MTLTADGDKKETELHILASRRERQAITDALDKLRERLIFDVNSQREKIAGGINRRAIQGAPDESGATDPLMYIKLDNFIRELRDAIATNTIIADLTMRPNEISRSTSDSTNMRNYTETMNQIREALDSAIIQRKDKSTTGLFGSPNFEVKAVFDLALIEDMTAGKRIEDLLMSGKIVPEYGATKIPAAQARKFYESKSYDYMMNNAFLVVVEDDRDAGLVANYEMPIKIDRKGWKSIMDYKKGAALAGISPTTLNAYKEIKVIQPKTKLDILQMAVTLAVGQNEGVLAPRPILAPQVAEYNDPDINQPRKYYIFTIGGYKGTRKGAKTLELAEDIAGIPNA